MRYCMDLLFFVLLAHIFTINSTLLFLSVSDKKWGKYIQSLVTRTRRADWSALVRTPR